MTLIERIAAGFAAVAADIKALQARPGAAVRLPFTDGSGAQNGILLTSGELPFFAADGTQHNIALVTYG